MFDGLKKLSIETCSDAELKAWVKQAIPVIIFFVQASQRLLNKLNTNSCESCEKRDVCTTLCDDVNSLIPGKFDGPANLNHTFGKLIEEIAADVDQARQVDYSSLRTIDRVRSDEIFRLYKNCLFLFTKKEWRVITLKVQQGMTYREIAEAIARSISNVSDIFQRAKKKMENHYIKKIELKKY